MLRIAMFTLLFMSTMAFAQTPVHKYDMEDVQTGTTITDVGSDGTLTGTFVSSDDVTFADETGGDSYIELSGAGKKTGDGFVLLGSAATNLDFTKTDSFSLVAMVRRKGSTAQTILAKVADSKNSTVGWSFYFNRNDHLGFTMQTDGSSSNRLRVISKKAVGNDQDEVEVTVVVNGDTGSGTTVSLYADGVLLATRTKTLNGDANNTSVPTMGANEDGSDYLKGTLDDVEIYDTALTPPPIKNRCGKVPGTIKKDITLSVPADYATIQDALACLDGKHILNKATVTISVTASATNYDTITVSHPQGRNIHILASGGTYALTFQSGKNGLYVADGSELGKINGFVFQGEGTAANPPATETSGVMAHNNAYVELGGNMVIRGFFNGIEAYDGATVSAKSIDVYDNQIGLFAYNNATIRGDSSDVHDNGGSGVVASRGGVISFIGGTSDDNTYKGIWAASRGFVMADNATATGNGEIDYKATALSLLIAKNSTSTTDATDYSADSTSVIQQ
ncbi:MAG: LamG domain-containing protein [Acidobacteriota bacterium]|nr:LamG domain-containing protein [Acidobacteriota bacterium]